MHPPARSEAAATSALLDTLMDGLVDEDSGALRALCAEACAEFLEWSARPSASGGSSSSKGGSRAGHNSASLMRRLFDRLSHPRAYNRRVG